MSGIFENRCSYNPGTMFPKSKSQTSTSPALKNAYCKQESNDSVKGPLKDGNSVKGLKDDWNVIAAAQAFNAARAHIFNQV